MIAVSIVVLFVSSVILLYSFFSYKLLNNFTCENEKALFIHNKISSGASIFLKCLYRNLAVFIFLASFIILLISRGFGFNYLDSFGFLYFMVGAFVSSLASYIGMKISTKSNILTALNSQKGLKEGFNTSFNSGALIGMSIVGLGLFSLSLFFLFYAYFCPCLECYFITNAILFAFGVESVALFCRVGGGIYTKAADIGADLVGKLEKNIPEDDPRNPAVIADNVGDNVGDIAGMGSDLLGSFVSSIIGSVFLFYVLFRSNSGFDNSLIIFPLLFCFCGTLTSIFVSKFFLCLKSENVGNILKNSVLTVTIINSIIALILVPIVFPSWLMSGVTGEFYHSFISLKAFLCIFIGLVSSALVSFFTKYYTDKGYSPLKYILNQSRSGASTNIISGLCVGMESVLPSILTYFIGVIFSYKLFGFYGISLAAVGIMSTAMIQLSIDAFGPIVDNAGGIAEMSDFDSKTRENTDILDSLGNTTAATGKSFAITSAVFTFLSLFAGLLYFVKCNQSLLGDVYVLLGLLIGVMIPYLFSSIVIRSVGVSSLKMVDEVRRQFSEISGLKNKKADPDYDKCISIPTEFAIKGMIKSAVMILIVPFIILILFKVNMGIGFLVGIFLSSVLLGIFHSNSGGIWDNTKKTVEAGVEIDGVKYGKDSDIYKSTVVGDTVGDPLKDTSGPSMNIVLKLTVFLFIILSPMFVGKNTLGTRSKIVKPIIKMSDSNNKNSVKFVVNNKNDKKPLAETKKTVNGKHKRNVDTKTNKNVDNDKDLFSFYLDDFIEPFFGVFDFNDDSQNIFSDLFADETASKKNVDNSKKSVKKDKKVNVVKNVKPNNYLKKKVSNLREGNNNVKNKGKIEKLVSGEETKNIINESIKKAKENGLIKPVLKNNNSFNNTSRDSKKVSRNNNLFDIKSNNYGKYDGSKASSKNPKVYENKDDKGNYEKLTDYGDEGYFYESYYSNAL